MAMLWQDGLPERQEREALRVARSCRLLTQIIRGRSEGRGQFDERLGPGALGPVFNVRNRGFVDAGFARQLQDGPSALLAECLQQRA